MNDSHNPSENYGGFDDSDDQTFSSAFSKGNGNAGQESGKNPDSREKGTINPEKETGFISYLQPEPDQNQQNSANKGKYFLLVAALLMISSILWLLLPDNTPKDESTVKIDSTNTVKEQKDIPSEGLQEETLVQDSLARVQDYLARMQMAEGKPLDNNEDGGDMNSAATKAPEKKVIPPDPIPAESFKEYQKNPEKQIAQEQESIQTDIPKSKNSSVSKVVTKPGRLPSENAKPLAKIKPLAKDASKAIADSYKQKVTPNSKEPKTIDQKKSISNNEVMDETFVDRPKDKTMSKVDSRPNQDNKKLDKAESNKGSSLEKYSVQVFSSVSRAEAEQRLSSLKAKGVSSAFISKQSLKGKTWYRVRFGAYSSRNEAKGAASKAGYSKAWVDRVQ